MSPPRPPPKQFEAGNEIGTLVIVVDRARNLVDKQRIGKQSPYVTLRIPSSPVPTKRTQTINRGGQAPEWDAELRFPIMSELEDSMGRRSSSASTASTKSMSVVCWADDSRDPTKVGEAFVDLTRSLTKGEDDLWVPLTLDSKDGGKYRGEVRLELTFFSNASPPPKKYPTKPATQSLATPTRPPAKRAPRLSAPGERQPTSSSSGNNNGNMSGSIATTTSTSTANLGHPTSLRPGHPATIPQSLRTRQSLSNMSLYRPDYIDGGELRIPSPLPSPQPENIPASTSPIRQPSPNTYAIQPVYQEQPLNSHQEHYQQPLYQVSPGHSPIPQVSQVQPLQSSQTSQPSQPSQPLPQPPQAPLQQVQLQQMQQMQMPPMQQAKPVTPIPPPRTSPIPPVSQMPPQGPQGPQFPQVSQQIPIVGQSPVFAQYPSQYGAPLPVSASAPPPAQAQAPAPQGSWSPWQNPSDVQYSGAHAMYAQQQPSPMSQPPQPSQQSQPSRPLPSAPAIQSPFPQYPPPGAPTQPPQVPQPPPSNVVYAPPPPTVPQQPVQMYPNYPPPPIGGMYGAYNGYDTGQIQAQAHSHTHIQH
ncbi:hypothetical protein E3P98_00296 [Wallemia ichthyophaga]|nr:hypothetical protein E3P98_00296 [Wallemia ichthyophaga]